MHDIVIKDMELKDIYELSRSLRIQDAEECERLGSRPRSLLRDSYRHALIKKSAFVDGGIAACWGLGGVVLGDTGRPWLMTTKEVEKVPLAFVGIYKYEVEKMLSVYSKLENWCDSKYVKSLKMLRLAGFKVADPEPYGPHKSLFCRFTMEA